MPINRFKIAISLDIERTTCLEWLIIYKLQSYKTKASKHLPNFNKFSYFYNHYNNKMVAYQRVSICL